MMEIERVDYSDAVRLLAEQERIDMSDFENKRQSSPEYKTEKEKAKRITKLAQEFFVWQLYEENGSFALSYLQNNRALSDQLIKQLGLWYAPSQSQSLFSYFQQHGFSIDDLVSIGLVKQGQNEMYSFFRDRLIIPIRDQLGNIIAFWARALQAGQEPKYLNSPESIIYDKSKVLYGLDHLKRGVKDHQAIIIVEGYFDVIALQAAGLDIGVATCGTSLTESHMTTLQRYHDNIVFLFDNDSAGVQATLRWLAIAYAQGVYPKIIDLNVIVRNETIHSEVDRHGHTSLPATQVRGAMTKVKDIDELVRNNPQAPEQVQSLIANAQDGFLWAMNYYTNIYNLNNPVERQKMLQGLFDLIYASKTMSTQNLFLEQISQLVRMDVALVMSQYRQYVKTEKRVFRPRQDQQAQTSQESEQRTSQKELLLWALLAEDFWKTIDIDGRWIEMVREFLVLIHYHHADHELEEYNERQLWREKELGEHDASVRTKVAKQVLVPYLHTLQKNALKSLNADEKHKVLGLVNQLR